MPFLSQTFTTEKEFEVVTCNDALSFLTMASF